MFYIIATAFSILVVLFCISLCKAASKEESFYENLERKRKNN
ncbi:hypothetical protein [Clostridium yunnanense]|nr:hypothetical protein [Clostridium yunnanense]